MKNINSNNNNLLCYHTLIIILLFSCQIKGMGNKHHHLLNETKRSQLTIKINPIAIVNPDSVLLKLNIQLVEIEGGSFEMGGDSKGTKPIHTVTLDAYYMSETEITFHQYDLYCENTGKRKPSDRKNWGRENRPVINISSDEAMAFCTWLSKVTGSEYRLPTEAEWEYAAREKGKDNLFGNGKQVADPEQINFNGSKNMQKEYSVEGNYRKQTLPVASFSPNSLGLYDMSGNVREWCSDWYEDDYYKNSPSINPTGGRPGKSSYAPEHRILRGGAWNSGPSSIRCFTRGVWTHYSREDWVGFRIVKEK